MAQFESRKEDLGTGLAYIAAEKRDGVWNPVKYLEKRPISFPFLLDEDREVTKAYGLHHLLGHDAMNIAHPATLIVERGGVIRYIYRGDNQHDRAPVDEVIKAVKEIAS